ncbi:MAG: zeta toxin family protein [Zoogloeaceae bacterium]|jgi:predicted ABC-type ATPase|nr:zeta toxin family protein [Zoogloeaceae bacterium]
MFNHNSVLIVIAGANGSGKTSFTTDVLAHEWLTGCAYINPDNIARDVYGDWNDRDAIIKAARYAEDERERHLSLRESMAFESVMSTRDKVDFIKRARANGYFVRLFFVGTDSPIINGARITKRMILGGHEVPLSKVLSRYPKSLACSVEVASFADRAYFLDNSIENEKPRLLFRTENGAIVRYFADFDAHPWAMKIAESITD